MSELIPSDAYVMIIGGMKCGTSSLYYYLKDHPQICESITKEPEFFSENQAHAISVESYTDLFPFDPARHKCTLEASTGYTKYPAEPNVARKIYECGINPKFIYVVRNPFDRIQSHHNFMRQEDPIRGVDIDHQHPIRVSDYFLQLEQYRKYFPIENILVLDFDDLKYAPRALLEQVYEFIGVSHDYFPANYKPQNITKSLYQYERLVLDSEFAPLIPYLPKPIRKAGRSILKKTSPDRPRYLTSKQRNFILEELNASMIAFQDVYGFNVAKWGFNV